MWSVSLDSDHLIGILYGCKMYFYEDVAMNASAAVCRRLRYRKKAWETGHGLGCLGHLFNRSALANLTAKSPDLSISLYSSPLDQHPQYHRYYPNPKPTSTSRSYTRAGSARRRECPGGFFHTMGNYEFPSLCEAKVSNDTHNHGHHQLP